MVPLRFQTPISAPTASRMKIALVTEATAPLPASWTARERVAVLHRDQRGDRAAQHQGDLDRAVERVEPEQRERAGDQDGERDQRQERVGERRRPDAALSFAAGHGGTLVTAVTGVLPRNG